MRVQQCQLVSGRAVAQGRLDPRAQLAELAPVGLRPVQCPPLQPVGHSEQVAQDVVAAPVGEDLVALRDDQRVAEPGASGLQDATGSGARATA
jgi:hypothetical protein